MDKVFIIMRDIRFYCSIHRVPCSTEKESSIWQIGCESFGEVIWLRYHNKKKGELSHKIICLTNLGRGGGEGWSR